MSLTDANFIDGDVANIFQRGLGEVLSEVSLLDFFDNIPSDAQLVGDIFDGHAPRQLQRVPGLAFGEATTWLGKADLDLSNVPAIEALHTRQIGNDESRLCADRRGSEFPNLCTSTDHVVAATG